MTTDDTSVMAALPGCDAGFVRFDNREVAQRIADSQAAAGMPPSNVVEHDGHWHVELIEEASHV